MRCSGGLEDVWILRTKLGRWKKGAVGKRSCCLSLFFLVTPDKKEKWTLLPFLFSKLFDIHIGLTFLFSVVSVNQLVYFQNSFERNFDSFWGRNNFSIWTQFGLN